MSRRYTVVGAGVAAAFLGACGDGDATLAVRNVEPVVSVVLPSPNSSFDEGEVVTIQALLGDDDPVTDLDVSFSSSISGTLAEGVQVDASGRVEWVTSALEPGEHTVIVRAFDAEGASGQGAVQFTIVDLPDRPSISFVHPDALGEERGLVGYPFVFQVEASDHQDLAEDLEIEILANPYGLVCIGSPDGSGKLQCPGSLPLGVYTLTATATDTDGFTATATTPFFVVSRDDYDGDGDGYSPSGGDCNDATATVYPGADEICDGLDNDCIPATEIDVGTECYDDDGDGYCEDPPCVNTTNTLGDCNDANAERYPNPALPEYPNNLDDDCDGVIDEGTAVYDDDGDGYCESPPCRNASGAAADCNDANPGIHPAATEVCSDGLDNDCDGLSNERNATGCRNFYYDADGDTYGVSGTPQCWCDTGVAPYTGLNTTDCYDNNANARPGQTAFFTVHRGDNKFDYNCDSTQEKQYSGTSTGCRWDFEPFTCDLKTGEGWVGSVPSCGQERTYTSDCAGSYDIICIAFCAYTTDPELCDECWSCEAESATRAQGCR